MTTVRNVELTPAMWDGLAKVRDRKYVRPQTLSALRTRGLIETVQGDPYFEDALTDAGRELLAKPEAQSAAPAAQPEMITVAVPRTLADAVTAAWTEAYREGMDDQQARYEALADAYDALRNGIRSHRYPWLSRALQDARCDAVSRAQNTPEQW